MMLKSVRQRILLWVVAFLLLFTMLSFSANMAPVFAGGSCTQSTCSGG